MPWHIGQHESCPGFAVIKDSDGSVAGCHGSEEGAKRQLAALYAAEPESRAAKYDHINFKPPSGVRAEAQKGLDWRSEFGRGGTGVGIARARDLSNGVKISPETARRMKAFFDRHQSDRNAEGWSPGEKGFPSNGRIAHALWGGDAGYAWSRKLVRQMNAADEARSVSEFLEARGFCPTGSGGGIDNSCSSKGGGGGNDGSGGGKGKGKTWGDPPARNENDYSDEGRASAKKKADSLGFKGDTAYKVAHPAHLAVGSTIHVKAPNGGESYGEVAYIQKSPDGKSYQAVLNSPQRGRDNDMLKPVSIDITPGSEIHSLSGNYTHKNWKPASGKRIRPSKEKYGPSYLHTKLRSHEMQIETRSLCLDDFSEDDAFPLLRIERRCCEERADGPEESWLVGYAARFGVNSLKMDDFYERIDPSAFNIVTERRGRKSPLETRALFNHDPNHVLGRFPSTLRMKVDEHGLRYEIKMPESRRDLIESIERGDIRGSSFSFIVSPGGEEWSVEEGRSIRTVKSIASLIDVGPVTFPAYPDASVSVARRSYMEFMRARQVRRSAICGHRAEIQKFLRERGR